MTPIPTERLEEMLRGTEGVTKGPWQRAGASVQSVATGYIMETNGGPTIGNLSSPRGADQRDKDAEFIARCDPDTIRSLITELLSSRRTDTVEAAEVVKPVAFIVYAKDSDNVVLCSQKPALAEDAHAKYPGSRLVPVYAAPVSDFGAHWYGEICVIGAMLNVGAPDAGEMPKAVQAMLTDRDRLSSQVEGLKVERDAAWLAQNNLIARAEKAEATLASISMKLERVAPQTVLALDMVREALASQAIPEGFVLAPKEPAEAWRDISSAPLDGTVVDLFGTRNGQPQRFTNGAWLEKRQWGTGDPTGEFHWVFDGKDAYGEFVITHWMTTPEAPL